MVHYNHVGFVQAIQGWFNLFKAINLRHYKKSKRRKSYSYHNESEKPCHKI